MQNYDDLDRATLLRLLKRRDAERQLGLVWERDEIESDKAKNNDFVALSLDLDLSHGEAPWENLIIEGDNYDALRALRVSHKNSVKCIYIDPPYNTGNRDFIYNDRFVDKSHRFRHSLWIEFMYQRLLLAKELLSDDGVIFVSIDDNELFRLGMLMDKVFGMAGKLACFTWQTDGNFDNQAKIKVAHEYVLAYSKNPELIPNPPVVDPNVPDTSKLFRAEIRNTIVKNGPKNPVSELVLPVGFPAAFDNGVIEARNDPRWPKIKSDIRVESGVLQVEAVLESGWANRALCEKFIAAGFKSIEDSKGQETRFELTQNGVVENVKVRSASHVVSVLRNMGSTQSDSLLLGNMGIKFSYPKPVSLISYLVSIMDDDSATVLDFFAGSGTTAHAVAKLNSEDGGSRKFILVGSTESTDDQPGKNLCRDVCAKRVRAIQGGYVDSKGTLVDGYGGNFAYLRARRIPTHRLTQKLDHAEIWNALQLMHGHPLTPWQGGGFAADIDLDDGNTFAYLSDAYPASKSRMEEWLVARGDRAAAIYTWSPERYRTSSSPHEWRAIPQHLRERFGR